MGVPIRGKRNPYLILSSREPIVDIEVEVEEYSKPTLVLENNYGWQLRLALTSFIEEVCNRLEQPLKVSISISVDKVKYPPQASLYAITTIAIVKTVAEEAGYELTDEEVLKACNSIDEDAGVGLDYVNGLRTELLIGEGIVYREGEKPIRLSLPPLTLEFVGEEEVANDISNEINEALLTLITKVAGNIVIEYHDKLNSLGVENWFKHVSRLENALYYLLYGIKPPEEKCKWTPSLQAAYAICLEGAGLGEPVSLK